METPEILWNVSAPDTDDNIQSFSSIEAHAVMIRDISEQHVASENASDLSAREVHISTFRNTINTLNGLELSVNTVGIRTRLKKHLVQGLFRDQKGNKTNSLGLKTLSKQNRSIWDWNKDRTRL